jgi:tRNA threonylcarbamoyladenosine biosynthesis protein TsaE
VWEIIRITNSAQETTELGERFTSMLKEKDVVILEGVLGGGKTTFVKGVLKGFGYRGEVRSPSFTILRQYKIKSIYIYHIDLYRVDDKEIFSFGLEDYIYLPGSITLVEWGGKIRRLLSHYINIEFFFLESNRRKIILTSNNGRKINL